MGDIPAHELRNDVSAVLRRVEAGEWLRVTVDGRPVAHLVPLVRRPRFLSWEELGGERIQADAGLTAELAELLPDDAEIR